MHRISLSGILGIKNKGMGQRERKIIHIDMDAFYASVEMMDHPELAGKPVIVGGSPESRGVVCAANYEARKFGVHSAMACSRAHRLCPDAVFLRPRFERYKEISAKIHTVFKKYTDLIEPLSLDEAWLDVTENHIHCPSATVIAQKIKTDIKESVGLVASAGVSYNKFLAKIASDEDKPDGLFVIIPRKSADFLKNIPLKKIPGVGRVTAKKLRNMGLETGHQLLEKSEEDLQRLFGKLGTHLYSIIRGVDLRPVVVSRERKSVGVENTFAENLQYGEDLLKMLRQVLDELEKRLERSGKKGKTATVKVKFGDFKQVTRSFSQEAPLDMAQIAKIGHDQLYKICTQSYPNKEVRLLGVSVSNFSNGEKSEVSGQLDIDYFLSALESKEKPRATAGSNPI